MIDNVARKGRGGEKGKRVRSTRRLLVSTATEVAGGLMWTEVHLEVTHGFVPKAEEEVPRMREVHCSSEQALGPVSQAAETAVAVPQLELEAWLSEQEASCDE